MNESDYPAIVAAAARMACSPIVSRDVRDRAEEFVDAEIARWELYLGSEDSDDDSPSESASFHQDDDTVFSGPTNADLVAPS